MAISKPVDAATRRPADEWRLVIALTLIAMLAMLDRYALSLLVQPLKADLGLTDTEVGIAVGAGFAIANIAISIPAGWAADRFSRRAIVFAGVVLWSAMTVICGLATTFLVFLLARAGVGLGEGMIPPASYSLIRDGVSPERHGRAFTTFAMANTLGPGSAILLVGTLVGAIVAFDWHWLPLFGDVKPWQFTLILLGVLGMPLAGLAYIFKAPERHHTVDGKNGYPAAITEMRRQRAIYLPLIIFSCCSAMVASSLGIWFPAYVGRVFGLGPQIVGPTLGLILMIGGPLGLFVAGTAMDWLRRRGSDGAGPVAIVAAVMLLLFATLVPLAPSLPLMWTLEAGVVLCSTCYFALVSTVVSKTAPPAMVGKVMALLLVLQGIFGSGIAPVVVGWLADHAYSGQHALGMALATNAAVLMSIGVVAALFLARGLKASSGASQ